MHETVAKRSAEMDQKEVLGLKLFLKQLANEYYDMELLTRGIQDETKVASAKLVRNVLNITGSLASNYNNIH